MVVSFVCLAASENISMVEPLEMSNFYCHPGKAGGTLGIRARYEITVSCPIFSLQVLQGQKNRYMGDLSRDAPLVYIIQDCAA